VTTWDEAKRRRNLQKHGVDLAIAERFDFVTAVIQEDDSETYGEQRQIAISLRKATRRERRRYAEKA
jgi:uncharacterized DUF497 family protein